MNPIVVSAMDVEKIIDHVVDHDDGWRPLAVQEALERLCDIVEDERPAHGLKGELTGSFKGYRCVACGRRLPEDLTHFHAECGGPE